MANISFSNGEAGRDLHHSIARHHFYLSCSNFPPSNLRVLVMNYLNLFVFSISIGRGGVNDARAPLWKKCKMRWPDEHTVFFSSKSVR